MRRSNTGGRLCRNGYMAWQWDGHGLAGRYDGVDGEGKERFKARYKSQMRAASSASIDD